MWFGVLGRLEVRGTDGSGVAISGPARRRLLAALVGRAGRPASAAALIDDLWGESPPRSALMSLRTHVLRLRAELASAGAETVLVTAGDGYQLCVDAEDIDANRFAALVEQAHRCAEPRRAIERYDEALALWRDEAYFEFGDASFAVDERVRLAELRGKARERRTDLGLAAGLSGDLVPELEQRVRSAPYRERGWEQLALALYRDGRQADALDACRRARRLLVDDLGVEPGPGLRELEQRMLRQE